MEGAKLIIERVPLVMCCKSCSESFRVDIHEKRQIECPRCQGTKLAHVSGKEYRVENMASCKTGEGMDSWVNWLKRAKRFSEQNKLCPPH